MTPYDFIMANELRHVKGESIHPTEYATGYINPRKIPWRRDRDNIVISYQMYILGEFDMFIKSEIP